MRLEQASHSDLIALPSFQFHKGAIRTGGTRTQEGGFQRFQFHKGAIRTTMRHTAAIAVLLFQFHKGAIRTGDDEDDKSDK